MSGSKGEILVGTTDGDVIAFSDDNLTQINRFSNVCIQCMLLLL